MIPTWSEFAALLGLHPGLALSVAAGSIAGGWALHIWQLRGRERHLTLLVDERTRLWQEEVAAHATLRARVDGALAGETAATAAEVDACADRVTRVLVVDDHRERREAMIAVFEEFGIAPVFADSPWAASIASQQADADGTPYDVILIDPSMEGVEAADRLVEPLPAAGSDGWRLIRDRLEAV
jgi:hypothetical protein